LYINWIFPYKVTESENPFFRIGFPDGSIEGIWNALPNSRGVVKTNLKQTKMFQDSRCLTETPRFLDEIPRFPIDRNSKISEIPKPKLDSESGSI
jgi:hypothetical protein